MRCPHCAAIISRPPDEQGVERVPTRMMLMRSGGRIAVVCGNCRGEIPIGRLRAPKLVLVRQVVDIEAVPQ